MGRGADEIVFMLLGQINLTGCTDGYYHILSIGKLVEPELHFGLKVSYFLAL